MALYSSVCRAEPTQQSRRGIWLSEAGHRPVSMQAEKHFPMNEYHSSVAMECFLPCPAACLVSIGHTQTFVPARCVHKTSKKVFLSSCQVEHYPYINVHEHICICIYTHTSMALRELTWGPSLSDESKRCVHDGIKDKKGTQCSLLTCSTTLNSKRSSGR